LIVIDHREPANLESWFRDQNINIELQRKTLEIADYLIIIKDKVVPVERKQASDYIDSLFTKHLNNQLYFMSYHYKESFLVITGDFTEILLDGRIKRKQLIASRISVVTKYAKDGAQGRINIIPLESDWDLPECLYLLHKAVEESDYTRNFHLQGKKDDDNWLISMYAGLPGVGTEKAKSLRINFPSLLSIVSASIDQLKESEGIGEKLAERIYNKIRDK